MKRHLKVLLAGALVVVPFAITVYIVWALAGWLGRQGYMLLNSLGVPDSFPDWLVALLGAMMVVLCIYLVGLMTKLWIFRYSLGLLESWITRLPGIKTVYESVRDLMKLFGGDSSKMGRSVMYRVPGTDMSVIGILTNDSPLGVPQTPTRRVALYLPFSYMFGGPTIYVSPEHVEELDISVEQVLKLAATAHVGAQAIPPSEPGPAILQPAKPVQ